jgi:hypothetical protein
LRGRRSDREAGTDRVVLGDHQSRLVGMCSVLEPHRVIGVLAAETYVIHGPEGSYELSFVVNGNDIEITRNTIPRDAPDGDVLADPKKAWKEYRNRKRKTGGRR